MLNNKTIPSLKQKPYKFSKFRQKPCSTRYFTRFWDGVYKLTSLQRNAYRLYLYQFTNNVGYIQNIANV